jgi:formate/nitrite transporter FocA (FNT family)
MKFDLLPTAASSEPAPQKAATQILNQEIREGLPALELPTFQLFVSALSGGLDIGFSVLLMGVVYTQSDQTLPKPVVNIFVANMYSLGFIFVVLGRSE